MTAESSIPEALAGYERFAFTHGPWTRTVYRKGSGPAVIVMHEMPNLHPMVVRFATRVAAAGMTVYLPSLFGRDGKVPSKAYSLGQMLLGICVRREFNVWANGRSSHTRSVARPSTPNRTVTIVVPLGPGALASEAIFSPAGSWHWHSQSASR